jgi:hypothetical protein
MSKITITATGSELDDFDMKSAFDEISDILFPAFEECGFDAEEINIRISDEEVDGHDPSDLIPSPSRGSDPPTSKAAAKVNYPRAGTQRHKILVTIGMAGDSGFTAEEAADRSGVDYRSATPRIGQLKREEFILGTGQTRTGPYGAEQEILVVTEKAKRYLEEREGMVF